MNKHFVILVIIIFAGMTVLQGQSRQDSLFLEGLTAQSKQLIEGKAYILETEKQQLASDYDKSPFIKVSDEPVFSANRTLQNGLHYSVFGEHPIVFNGTKADKIKIEKQKYACLILLFTCNGQQYKVYEVGAEQAPSRAYYNLIEAEYLKTMQNQLVGKTLYTQKVIWWQYNESRMNSNHKLTEVEEPACKYCPVTVTRVVNDYDDKYTVLFRKGNQGPEYAFGNVVFDYKDIATFLNFDTYFTFTNPQEQYPAIPQARWEQIMAQKITKGFTPEEVKIAFGRPDETTTENDDETWIYYNYNKRDYAITFKNGVVENIVSQTAGRY